MGKEKTNITVADVAQVAGVSKAQAARAMGGYGAVSEEVLDRVLKAAESLGYRPNRIAKSMSTGLSNTIGVVVGDIENPNFSVAIRGMTDAAQKAGYRIFLANSDEDLATEQAATRLMLESRVDGMIITPCSEQVSTHIKEIVDQGRELVLFDRSAPGIAADTITADYSEVSVAATQLLLDAGHRHIAYISSRDFHKQRYEKGDLYCCPVGQRINGMISAFNRNAIPFDADFIQFGANSLSAVCRILDDLFARDIPPTVIIASDGLIAQNILTELQRRQIRIPTDISFLMYDDFPWAQFITPGITVIAQPVYDMGYEAGRRLVTKLQAKPCGEIPQYMPELIVRESIAPLTSGMGGNN